MRHLRVPVVAVSLALWATPGFAQPAVPFGDAGLHAVQFIDESEGWAVGDDGVIWHSIDGGGAWERQKSGTRASLRGVHFLTPYTGWVVGRNELPGGGSASTMLKTSDGGLELGGSGHERLAGTERRSLLRRKEGHRLRGRQQFIPIRDLHHPGRRPPVAVARGAKLPSSRAMAFFGNSLAGGVIAGAWSRLGRLESAGDSSGVTYAEADFDPLAGRSLHAISTQAAKSMGTAVAVGDGGAVLVSNDAGRKWGFANLGLSPEAAAACDFRCVASVGQDMWVAGKPGGFVLHSADNGKTWEIQRTELPAPVSGIYFLTNKAGWMVGELGHDFRNRGWRQDVEDPAGRRAGASRPLPARIPADDAARRGFAAWPRRWVPLHGTAMMSADPATADAKRAGDAARLRQAMRLAGGAAGDTGWAFPLAAHAGGLPPRELMASWDRMHGGKAAEQLLRQAVLAVRMWQPEVVLTDPVAADGPAADVLVLHAAKEAFKQAADPACFPEQITALGLKPWAAKKLYALTANAQSALVSLDQAGFYPGLSDSPRDYAEPAERVLADVSAGTDRRGFVLVAHRLADADKQPT